MTTIQVKFKPLNIFGLTPESANDDFNANLAKLMEVKVQLEPITISFWRKAKNIGQIGTSNQIFEINELFTEEITVPIICPRNNCQCANVKRKGFDKKHSALPQFWKCSKCKKIFYAHTSLFFKHRADLLVRCLLHELLGEHQRQIHLATRYGVSQSTISVLARNIRKKITARVRASGLADKNKDNTENFLQNLIPTYDSAFQLKLGLLDRDPNDPKTRLFGQNSNELIWNFPSDISGTIILDSSFYATMLGQNNAGIIDMTKIVVMDETFLKIGGKTFYLVVAVTKEGQLLSWSLTRTRTTDDVNSVFLRALIHYKFPGVIITDGLGSYRSMIALYPYSIIHIVHLHKRPYGRVNLYCRYILPKENRILELQVATTTRLFAESGQKTVFVHVKDTELVRTKKKAGRPKGKKNRPKDVIEAEKLEKAQIRMKRTQERVKKAQDKVKKTQERVNKTSAKIRQKAQDKAKEAKKKLKEARAKARKARAELKTIREQAKNDKSQEKTSKLEKTATKIKTKPKKRGPKDIRRIGTPVDVTVDLDTKALTIDTEIDAGLQHVLFFLLWTLLFHFNGKCLTSNYVENFFAQFKFFLNRGSRKDALVFLNTFQTYVVTYQDRIFQSQRFYELLDEILTDYSVPPTLGYRQYFDPHGSLRVS